jgi:hypothetical protein
MSKQKASLVEHETGVYVVRGYRPPSQRLDQRRLEHIIKTLIRRAEDAKRAKEAPTEEHVSSPA